MIMKIEDKYITEVKNGFQQLKGKGSLYCFNKDIIPKLVCDIVGTFKAKRNFSEIMIAVDKYETRSILRKHIDEKFNEDKDFLYTCLSEQYINPAYKCKYDLTILVGVNSNYRVIEHLFKNSSFTICILTENIMDNVFITKVRNILPNISTITNINNLQEKANIYSPVEEHRIGVYFDSEDKEEYDKQTDYINTSIRIFGELSNIEKCKNGDPTLNISAASFREQLARENGWSEELDTSIEFHKQIDDIYNPNTLYERACTFYTITKKRRDFVSDSNSKLEAILKICKDNPNKQILIISKRGEFAAKVTKYLMVNNVRCGDFHDNIEDTILRDEYGVPLLIKSGKHKGEPKIIKSQAISSLNLRAFNDKVLNVLSIKNSSNNGLKTACDIVIITSPLCDDIIEIKKRFNKIAFNGIPTSLFMIYCKNTIESETLKKRQKTPLINVIEEEENFIGYDENYGAVVL